MSNNLMDLVQGQLSEGLIQQLSQQIGGEDTEKTAAATQGILSTLMGALARNAGTPEGAQALNNALERDHDGSVLDNITNLIGGFGQREVAPEQSRTLNGNGILEHILGNRQGGVIEMISKMSGLDSDKTGNLMTTLAPIVMGMLGKQKRQENLDADGLSSLLNGMLNQQRQSDNPAMNLVTRFLDADGDGSIMDDVANIGMKFLGNLFRK